MQKISPVCNYKCLRFFCMCCMNGSIFVLGKPIFNKYSFWHQRGNLNILTFHFSSNFSVCSFNYLFCMVKDVQLCVFIDGMIFFFYFTWKSPYFTGIYITNLASEQYFIYNHNKKMRVKILFFFISEEVVRPKFDIFRFIRFVSIYTY